MSAFRKVGLVAAVVLGSSFTYKHLSAGKTISTECRGDGDNFRCIKYIDNHDGDTFTAIIPRVHAFFGNNIPVRIAHIDTAELDSKSACERKSAEAAKKFVSNILSSSKKIDLLNVKRDKYFRILAEVRVNDSYDLAEKLISERLAVKYEGEKKAETSWCLMAPNSP